jgi:hypothetical protein
MSGFLQRLASGVLHAQRAIHPAVGTIWTAAGMMEQSGKAEPIEYSGEVRTPAPQRRADAPELLATQQTTQLAARPQMQPERNAAVSDSAVHGDPEQPAIAESVAFEPLVASAQRMAVSTVPPAQQANATTQQSEAILPPPYQEQMHRVETTRLLVPVPRIPAPATAGARKASSFLPPSQRHAQPTQSHVAEPDSIEIHIGRIEVLAAPPRPAQPAAPRSARKSLDLGEYLRRERRPR